MPPSEAILPRHAQALLEEALRDSRVIALIGPRQAGKTTLARKIATQRAGTYTTLDDLNVRAVAREDPSALLAQRPPVVIDEFQFGGDALLRAVKMAVDRDPTPGRFLLTGSTRYLTVPTISESLAGRVSIVDLWPLSQGELRRRRDAFVDRLFGGPRDLRKVEPERLPRAAYADLLCVGGFPTVRALSPRRRAAWFEDYVRTVTQSDVGEVSHARRIEDLPKLLNLLAARTAQELNTSAIGQALGMPRTTLSSYLPLLEAVFLCYRLPAWSRNASAKVIRHPKVHLTDCGLAADLLGAGPAALTDPMGQHLGPLLETFVAGELVRQRTWAATRVALHHFRDRNGGEVDVVLEARDGRVSGVEVKAASSVSAKDFRGLEMLRESLGKKFASGVVLYLGEDVLPFGDRLTLMPVSALWAP